MSAPTHWEKDGAPVPLMPNEARLRNLTYAAPLYVDITKRVVKGGTGGGGEGEDPDDPDVDATESQHNKAFIGKIPIMLRSAYCVLSNKVERDLTGLVTQHNLLLFFTADGILVQRLRTLMPVSLCLCSSSGDTQETATN